MSAQALVDALVIGAGPAGLSAAIYLGRFKRRFLVMHDGDSRAGYIPLTRNHPGFPDGISGPDLLDRMQRQAERFGATLRQSVVTDLQLAEGGFAARLGNGEELRAATILLASGVKDVLPPLAVRRKPFARASCACARSATALRFRTKTWLLSEMA